ncbi:hypothetical protein OIU78_019249 [Salix suchowensis]|nr:hypothetical protein OIU78_019249 [Salix suchowensis]
MLSLSLPSLSLPATYLSSRLNYNNNDKYKKCQ